MDLIEREMVRLIDPESGDLHWNFETDSISTSFVHHGDLLFLARTHLSTSESKRIAIHVD